jgi:RimJ/RimL family protein N-acetyltransferase
VFEQRFFKSAIASGGALAIVENKSGRMIGSSRYDEYDANKSEISIGYTFLESSHWGVGTNSEIKALMLEHIFNYVAVVWFHVGKINLRSRKAVEKLGAVLDYEKDRELDGVPYVQLYYRLDKSNYLR